MSPFTWPLVVIIGLIVLAACVCGIARRIAYQDGHEAGQLHERNTRNLAILARRDLAREQARIWGPPEDDWDRWLKSLSEDDGERLATTGELATLKDYHPAGGRDTSTGSFRALLAERTDQYIAALEAEAESYREGLTS